MREHESEKFYFIEEERNHFLRVKVDFNGKDVIWVSASLSFS